MSDTLYTERFFEMHEDGSRKSARATVPLLMEWLKPTSVVDVGCGIGCWLEQFQAAGVTDVLGIDGDYVRREALVIDPERFLPHDLGEPIPLERKFDLAMCLEVGEHLPDEAAAPLVASLVALAPVVLFSAAIPLQGGDGHINEQWPEYWQDKFAAHDYVVVDCLREPLWRHKDMMSWYSQNMLLYVQRSRLADYPVLAAKFAEDGEHPRLAMVHPDHYLGVLRYTLDKLKEAQRLALRSSVRLRDINLICFPDWSLPENRIAEQLRTLFAAVLTHPQSASMSLVVYFAGNPAGALLTKVANDFLTPGGISIAAAPAISGLNQSFTTEQWVILLECLTSRVVLPDEDRRAIAHVGADILEELPLSQLQSRQPFAVG